MKAVHLRTEHLENPLGLQTVRPVFSWHTDGGLQSAYEIIVRNGKTAVWKSGKVTTGHMLARCGYDAAPREHLTWRIRLWDENDQPGEWNDAWFEMGLLQASSWMAKWISPELTIEKGKRQAASYLKRTFSLERTDHARLYITCHGLYVAYLNGHRVGDYVLAPGTDDYHQRLQYQIYDVSPLLHKGKNEMLVVLGDGWYRGNNGIDGLNHYYGDDLALLCQMEVNHQLVLISDECWQASQMGPIRENDLQLGERYDARLEQVTNWHEVIPAAFDYDHLICSDSVPVREQERFQGKVFTAPNGDTLIDFGQNLAGYTELCAQAKAGQKIVLWHGETLDENGNFTQENFAPGERNKNGGVPQRIEYICKDGFNRYKPSFTLFGFRYAKIETDVNLNGAQFTAIAVYSHMPQTAFFTCGNEAVNQLFRNSLWSMKSNFCDIPTDCPTRERTGWTGDAAAFAPTGVMLTDCWPILRKWLAECRFAQADDGLMANIAPINDGRDRFSLLLQGSAGWGDACVLVPWALYQAYGDTAILEENYDMMRRWMTFLEQRARETRPANQGNPWKEALQDQGFHFGEWLEPDVNSMDALRKNGLEGAPEVATAYYFHSADLMGQIAAILGKPGDSEKYRKIAEMARKAYRYCCTDHGRIDSNRQCEYVRPIAFGLLDPVEAQVAADQLNSLVKQNGDHLNTGFLSTPDLCRVLTEHGHTDTAYRLLLQDTNPSWLYAIKKGATSIWETWDGIRSDGTVHDSMNHYAYGAICGWLLDSVCGIRLKDGKLTIRPYPHPSLGYAKARWNSPVGLIESEWRYEGSKLHLRVQTPIRAEIQWPDGRMEAVSNGVHSLIA